MAILVISQEKISPKLVDVLRRHIPDQEFRLWPETGDPEDIDYALAWKPPEGELAKLKRLKAIFSFAAGVDHLASDSRLPRHVPVVRAVSDASRFTMSSYCIAEVLRYHHRMAFYREAQSQRLWKQVTPRDAQDTRVAVLGLGVLGRDLAQRLVALGLPVNGWSRTPQQIEGVTGFSGPDQFLPCLAASTVAVCLLPLTGETRGILNARAFATMPKESYLINVARGGHVVEADLLAALDSGHLEGATLDVFDPEPLPPDSPLWSHPKITVTPHTAGRMSSARVALNMVDMMRPVVAGEAPRHVVDWSKGY